MPVGKSSDPPVSLLGISSDPFLCLWVNQVIRLYAFWVFEVIRFYACGHIFSFLFSVLGRACGPKRADADERAVADERAGADESPCFRCYDACHVSMRRGESNSEYESHVMGGTQTKMVTLACGNAQFWRGLSF